MALLRLNNEINVLQQQVRSIATTSWRAVKESMKTNKIVLFLISNLKSFRILRL